MPAVRACLCAAALAFACAIAAPVLAAGSVADREAARSLSGKAYEQFEAGQYRRAIDLFLAAEARFHAPPHLLYVARAQMKLGLLVEAKGTYERVVDEKLASDAPVPFKEAQVSARAELAEVDALLPSLVLTLPSSAPSGARVLIDGVQLDPGDIGRPLAQNPGAHTVTTAAPGGATVERVFTLKAGGGDVPLTLAFAPAGSRSLRAGRDRVRGGGGRRGRGRDGRRPDRHAGIARRPICASSRSPASSAGGLGIGAGIILVALRPRAAPAPVSVRRSPPPGRRRARDGEPRRRVLRLQGVACGPAWDSRNHARGASSRTFRLPRGALAS